MFPARLPDPAPPLPGPVQAAARSRGSRRGRPRRAAWHEALAALGPGGGPTSAACRTADCSTCATPTPSLPPPSLPRRSGAAPRPGVSSTAGPAHQHRKKQRTLRAFSAAATRPTRRPVRHSPAVSRHSPAVPRRTTAPHPTPPRPSPPARQVIRARHDTRVCHQPGAGNDVPRAALILVPGTALCPTAFCGAFTSR